MHQCGGYYPARFGAYLRLSIPIIVSETQSVAGGYVDSDYLLGISGLPNAGLVAGGGRTIVVLTANVAITATIVITADDNHPNILPMTASAIINSGQVIYRWRRVCGGYGGSWRATATVGDIAGVWRFAIV